MTFAEHMIFNYYIILIYYLQLVISVTFLFEAFRASRELDIYLFNKKRLYVFDD